MDNDIIRKIKMDITGKLAVEFYGQLLQTVVAMEEMAELSKELSKAIRKDFDLGTDSIAEEIADVEIMICQLKQIFKCHDAVNLWIDNKLARTLERIKEEAEHGESGLDNRAE